MKINCKRKTILIVDDDFNSLLLFSELLLESGAKVLTAIDGKSTLDIVEKQKIDLILLDIRLPDMDGFELKNNTFISALPVGHCSYSIGR